MEHIDCDICVIGAGMAGLACATRLTEAGLQVTVIDKGRGPGGRMAARRTEIDGETVSFDHGAQYFTARDPEFQAAVKGWEEMGVVARWPAAGDGAFVGTPGMNGPIRTMAQTLNVHWSTRAETITREDGAWRIEAGEITLLAKTVLVAIPAEQTHSLLHNVASDFGEIASQASSAPCWAVMVGFSKKLGIAEDVLRNLDAPISWAARNSAKPGRTGDECWVLHASPARSRDLIDLPKEEAATVLLNDFFAQTGAEPVEPTHIAAHRWLYAMAEAVKGEPARYDAEKRIGIAGDYLHSPRVEGAWLSGVALAERVLTPE
ncbi:FAD-dependent oxidoreductase [Erythrobacter sp. F6033]|uniref:NAD(P)/FAD-dependent oxidoreductase n=1 Tax=Erythrobacter sp. F6033 TaxID=2926401 RepID=UPI001FF18921|nr:FAD-dependent oxidoreductase [Erythrobacter sp. F6033]MCK0127949.1 FAD-dependent oxidoreductase [Erythrobacter sp. F6033]